MTFKGTALDDIKKILAAFPRRFTIKEVERYFEWPTKRVKQAIVMASKQTPSPSSFSQRMRLEYQVRLYTRT